MTIISLQLKNGVEVLTKTKKKEIRTIRIRKKTNVFICYDRIMWVKSSSESTNILELIKECSKIIESKYSMQNSRVPVSSCL